MTIRADKDAFGDLCLDASYRPRSAGRVANANLFVIIDVVEVQTRRVIFPASTRPPRFHRCHSLVDALTTIPLKRYFTVFLFWRTSRMVGAVIGSLCLRAVNRSGSRSILVRFAVHGGLSSRITFCSQASHAMKFASECLADYIAELDVCTIPCRSRADVAQWQSYSLPN